MNWTCLSLSPLTWIIAFDYFHGCYLLTTSNLSKMLLTHCHPTSKAFVLASCQACLYLCLIILVLTFKALRSKAITYIVEPLHPCSSDCGILLETGILVVFVICFDCVHFDLAVFVNPQKMLFAVDSLKENRHFYINSGTGTFQLFNFYLIHLVYN